MSLRPGICTAFTQEVWETLREGGIKTVTDFLTQNLEKVAQDLHLAYKDLCSIHRVLLAEHSAYPVSGDVLYQSALTSLSILPTGVDRFDDLLDGGLYTGEVTELAGDAASGKSWLCLQATAATVSNGDQVVFIDTCGSFCAEMIVEALVSGAPGLQSEEDKIKAMLQGVSCVQAFDVYELFAALDVVSATLSQQSSQMGKGLKLVVLDSLPSVIYPLVGGQFSHSQGLLNQLGQQLRWLAVHHSIAVLVTNNMTSTFSGQESRPALGKLWSHSPHTRVVLQRPQQPTSGPAMSKRRATVVKSSRQSTPLSAEFGFLHDQQV